MTSAEQARSAPRPEVVWALFVVTSAVVLLVQLPFTHATAWHFFADGSDVLFSADGLHLYAIHPELQFGPLSLVLAGPLTWGGEYAAMVVGSFAGLVALGFLLDALRTLRPDVEWSAAWLPVAFGGVVFLVVWGDVAVRTAHVDDALALLTTAVASSLAARGRPWGTAVALGVAGAAKPWAVAFAPVALVPAGGRRWPRLALTLGIVAATWAPFLLVEAETLDASSYEITNEASSALRALGFDAATTPSWVRPTQLLVGFALAWWLVRRGRWVAAVMGAVAVRLMLDPAANRYYTVGLVLGLLLFELYRRPTRLPWATAVAALLLELTQSSEMPGALGGYVRLAVTVVVLAAAIALPLPDPVRPRPVPVRSRS